jgi:hypothetical protein
VDRPVGDMTGGSGVPRVRRRRTRNETRELLLVAAQRIVIERVNGTKLPAANPLTGVRITDAIEEANRVIAQGGSAGSAMTTGAAYNIWSSQEEFQRDLLDRILQDAAVPGIDRVREVMADAISEGREWDDVLGRTIVADFEVSLAESTMFVMLGLSAMVPVAELVQTTRAANERYVGEMSDILGRIIDHGGRRLRNGRSIVDLVWAIEAIESGYLIRSRTHPDVPLDTGSLGDRPALAAAVIALVEAFTSERGEV